MAELILREGLARVKGFKAIRCSAGLCLLSKSEFESDDVSDEVLAALVGKYDGLHVFVTHEGEGAVMGEDHLSDFRVLLDNLPSVSLARLDPSSCISLSIANKVERREAAMPE
ncbi:MAG: hypothetical protein ACI8UZ_000690 [Akkermansiaceae bacterium]